MAFIGELPNTTVSAVVEYVWHDGFNFRSKTRVIKPIVTTKEVNEPYVNSDGGVSYKKVMEESYGLYISMWNYDGSSTGQARTEDSEIILVPHTHVIDPRKQNTETTAYFVVICDTYYPPESKDAKMKPTKENFRYRADKIFAEDKKHKQYPWFGLEQEYVIYATQENHLGIPIATFDKPMFAKESKSLDLKLPAGYKEKGQGSYYCSVGTDNALGRELADYHFDLCLKAGIPLSGKNAEVAPCQWEYQLFYDGKNPIEAGDYMMLSRYFLVRAAEDFKVNVSFNPKPYKEDLFNRSGCHINYSYEKMRNVENEYSYAIMQLEKVHHVMIGHMGSNELRLTGRHETSRMDKFTFGVRDRTATIRIPTDTAISKLGYIEYRAPASDVNPYVGISLLYEYTVLAGDLTKSEIVAQILLHEYTIRAEDPTKSEIVADSSSVKSIAETDNPSVQFETI